MIQGFLLVLFYLKSGVCYHPDSSSYIMPAKSLLSIGRMIDENGDPIIFRTPGYILFLALVYRVTNYSDSMVIILQMLMVLTITYMIYFCVSEIVRKKLLGCLAAIFYVCDLPIYTHAISMLTDTMYAFFMTLAFFLFYQYWIKQKIGFFVGSVIVINYAMLVRPQTMYYNLLLAVICAILAIVKKIGWKECFIYVCIFVLVYGGWSIRNYHTFGDAMYTSVRFESYYKWYGPVIYFLEKGVTEKEAYQVFETMMNEKYPTYETLPKIEQIYAQKDIGGSYIRNHILAYLKLNIRGLIKEMIEPDITEISDWNLPRLFYWTICFVFAGVLLFSYLIYAVGFLRTFRKQLWLDWLILLTVMYLMASTAVLGYFRFRLAFYPLCLIGTFSCWKERDEKKEACLIGKWMRKVTKA